MSDEPSVSAEALPVLPFKTAVLLPGTAMPLLIAEPDALAVVEAVLRSEEKTFLAVPTKDKDAPNPGPEELAGMGTLAVVRQANRLGDVFRLFVQGTERVEIGLFEQTQPHLRCRFEVVPDPIDDGVEVEAVQRGILDLVARGDAARASANAPPMRPMLETIERPLHQIYLIASFLDLPFEKQLELLLVPTRRAAQQILTEALEHEVQVLEMRQRLATSLGEEADRKRHEQFLRQQLEAIRNELGEGEEAETGELRERAAAIELPERVRSEIEKALGRIERLPPASPEHQGLRDYLDLVLELPWAVVSEDHLDLERARAILDEDHFDLSEVKDRIVEHLAVIKLNPDAKAPILCFVGPPGVGKTSLGQSIARALGRKFERLSLGGVHDEAELRGHRRTYVGALPGRIIQAIRRAGTRNPVLMLDEVDKLGNDFRGDPAAALLEILDPAQNDTFRDNFLELPFDLSKVFFVTTANTLDTIPRPLLDRTEVLALAGYTEAEKVEIARRYLFPRQLKEAGLRADQLALSDETLARVIRSYTREAGVRQLERQLGRLARKTAVRVLGGQDAPFQPTPEELTSLLGTERVHPEMLRRDSGPGVAAGLAWTEAGGEVLYVEAVRLPRGDGLTLTGQLGSVMQESARTAQSFVLSRAAELGIASQQIESTSVHIHVPAGATPKDGPSAGVAMASALASLYTGRKLRSDTAMTGEITLTGLVLPVGGVKEKVLAAHRAGLVRVVLPEQNRADLEEVPEAVRNDLEFVFAQRVEDVLAAVLEADPADAAVDLSAGGRASA